MSFNMNAGADMKTSQMKPSRLVMALLAAGAIGGAGAAALIGGV
jgi:serine protease Do